MHHLKFVSSFILKIKFMCKGDDEPGMSSKKDMLRHFLAALAYRGTKAIKNALDHYPNLEIGKGVATPRNYRLISLEY